MPMYDYLCKKCNAQFEEFRKLDDKTPVKCPNCGKVAQKIPSRVGFAIHNTGVSQQQDYQRQEDAYYEQEMKRRFNIRGVSKLRRSTMKQIYDDAIRQEGFINEQMAYQTEEKAKKTAEKQKEWRKAALKRTPERAKVIKEYKAKQAYEKRKVSI